MSSCMFCKILNGEMPSYPLYEDDEFLVILDRFPSRVGHSLVILKNHACNVLEIDDEVAGRAFALASKIAKKLKADLDCEGINILQNNGEVAGQTVMHFHIHIIPRYKKDDVSIGWKVQDPRTVDMEQMHARLK